MGKRLYITGQPDIMITNNHKEYNGLCIDKINSYKIRKAQLEIKKRYKQNEFLISNDCDEIIA